MPTYRAQLGTRNSPEPPRGSPDEGCSSLPWHRSTMSQLAGAPSGATINDSEQCLYQVGYQQILTVSYSPCLKSDTSVVLSGCGPKHERQRTQGKSGVGGFSGGSIAAVLFAGRRRTVCTIEREIQRRAVSPTGWSRDSNDVFQCALRRIRVRQLFAKGTPKVKGPDARSIAAFFYSMLSGWRRWFRNTDPLLVRPGEEEAEQDRVRPTAPTLRLTRCRGFGSDPSAQGACMGVRGVCGPQLSPTRGRKIKSTPSARGGVA